MNPFNARVASSSTRILTFSLQNGLGRAALTSSLTKNLIRSGLKFNHSLKELILGAISGWCPLHLIVAQLLYPPLFPVSPYLPIIPDFVFSSLTPPREPLALFRAAIGLRWATIYFA